MSSSDSRSLSRVHVRAPHPAVKIELFDSDLRSVVSAYGTLDAEVPVGLYEMQLRAGEVVRQQLISVRPDAGYTALDVDIPIPAVAPFHGTSTSRDLHIDAAARSINAVTEPGEVAAFVIVLRNVSERDARESNGGADAAGNRAANTPEPAVQRSLEICGYSLFDDDGVLVRNLNASFDTSDDSIATVRVPLRPGGHCLQIDARAAGGQVLRQAIWIEDGWETVLFVPNAETGPVSHLASASMVRLGAQWDGWNAGVAQVGIATELALAGLRRGRLSMPAELIKSLLHGAEEDPMLGLIGGHALLLSRKECNPDVLELLTDLESMLSEHHPDVVALRALAAVAAPREVTPPRESVAWPPMLRRSLFGLFEYEAATGHSATVDDGFIQRVTPHLVDLGVWTTWSAAHLLADGNALAEPDSWMDRLGAVRQPAFDLEKVMGAAAGLKRSMQRMTARMAKRSEQPWTERLRSMRLPEEANQRIVDYVLEIAAHQESENASELFDQLDPAWVSRSTSQPLRSVTSTLAAMRRAVLPS